MENNWIENVDGVCPAVKGSIIDVKFRDGTLMYGIEALTNIPSEEREATYAFWNIEGLCNDIVKWRFNKPEQSLDDALGTPNIVGDSLFTYPKTTFKTSSEAQLRADEAARVNNLLSEKLSTISDTVNKLTRKNFSVADIKLVKDLLESVEEYEENR